MMFLIHSSQPVERQMRINLRCGDIGVAENRLNGAQIGAILDHVRGAGMPQHVRRS